ncbi:putative peptidyl-prolyl cis-trans isomerase [subsurface metagenome]
MKRISFISLFLVYHIFSYPQTIYSDVVLETTEGTLILRLYDETPLHSENFLKLVNDDYYNNQLFHRVINNFMIQSGDPDSKNAKPGERLGNGGPNYTIIPEFNINYYHKRGALAAARKGDNVNPNRESSGSQFYIVHGRTFTKSELNTMARRGKHLPFSNDQIEAYTTSGGSPHLDYEYTIFGELIDGFDVLDKIASKPVDQNNRPSEDIKILRAYIKKR